MLQRILKIIFIVFILTGTLISNACTIFMANDGQNVWVGNNEDEIFSTKYRMWYYPAKKENFGYMIWTELSIGKLFYSIMYKNPQGIRMYSADAVKEFPDKHFDWVFIDANHSYEACLEDLRLWAPKVCDDGLLCGHDFAMHGAARAAKYGVVDAVKEFVKESGFGLAALTIEHFPTYVIAKNPSGQTAKRMRQLIFSYEPHVVQVTDAAAANIQHARLLETGLPRGAFMSFDFSKKNGV